MADTSNAGGVLDETLGRLAKKTGVKATIMLDRATGSILKMDGHIASVRTSIGAKNDAAAATDASAKNGAASTGGGGGGFLDADGNLNDGSADTAPVDDTKGARELAALVWNYIKVSGDLVEAIDTEDELKLLRLRTKKQELVIVPDPKYILIVIHDTPPA